MGSRSPIGIEVLIEEVQGLQNIDEICKAHAPAGMRRFSAWATIRRARRWECAPAGDNDYPGDIWYYPRFRLRLAARAAGIDPVDGPYGNYKNPDQYRKEATLGSILGCVGKWAIHPSQIDIALDVFTPKRDAVDAARHLSSEYAKAEAAGLGAVSIDGIMVDAATVRMMKNTLDKADLIGM